MIFYFAIGLLIALVWLIFGKDGIHKTIMESYNNRSERGEAVGGATVIILLTTVAWPMILVFYLVVSMVTGLMNFAVRRYNKQNNA